ncbi:hypothetical protein BVC80_1037g13 [Macleaya cordata]|uniref:LOB domain-containing protein n=1 Tax=Macleaya cordata TaxID=56857 RepID=A0A200QVJ1_MACCD|nr:hypothetical protein BVC80_1037g13 [Macleaya cordata]
MENKDGTAAAITTGARQACASCKHQRKKCAVDCVLHDFFPASKNADFQAVHRVFGVSNITKLLKSLRTSEERQKAIDSLVWEAQCRQRDPVSGSYGEFLKVFEELKLLRGHVQLHGIVTNQTGPKTRTNNKTLLIGWNGNNGVVGGGGGGGGGFDYNNNINSYMQNNGSFIEEPVQFGFGSLVQAEQEKRYQGRDGVAISVPNLLNQHEQYFYHPGNYAQNPKLLTKI